MDSRLTVAALTHRARRFLDGVGSHLTVAALTHRARRFLDGVDNRLIVAALTHRARRFLDGVGSHWVIGVKRCRVCLFFRHSLPLRHEDCGKIRVRQVARCVAL